MPMWLFKLLSVIDSQKKIILFVAVFVESASQNFQYQRVRLTTFLKTKTLAKLKKHSKHKSANNKSIKTQRTFCVYEFTSFSI